MIKWNVREASEAGCGCSDKDCPMQESGHLLALDSIVMVEVAELRKMIEAFMEFAVEEESLAFATRLLEELE